MAILLFILGLICLIVGAEALVRGASRLAALFGISPLIIGLTVMAFGTSCPELAVSIKAALSNQSSIAVGNIVGSNICNILLILGFSALVVPLTVAQQLVRIEVPLMIFLAVLTLLFSLDTNFSRVEGLILVACLIAYIGFMIRQSRSESPEIQDEYAKELRRADRRPVGKVKCVVLILVGFGLLVLGSRWLVDSAVTFAHYLGVSELIVGLTIVAAGTSLPEVVTSVIAAVRGERDIAVGNAVGSNLFNLMCVLGVACLVAPDGMPVAPAVIRFDIPVMIAVSFACLPIFFTGHGISRSEGAMLLGYYAAYMLYLILASSQHDSLPEYSATMLFFVIPLTVITLAIVAAREWRGRSTKRAR